MTYKKLYQRIRESTGLDVLTENVLQTIIENCFADITSRGYREFGEASYLPVGTASTDIIDEFMDVFTMLRDYQGMYNKPRINTVELVGNKYHKDLGITPLSETEIDELITNE